MAARNPGVLGSAGIVASYRPARPGTVFGVFVVAGLIGLLSILVYKELREGVFLGLLVFLVAGALWPPGAIALGLVIAVALFFRGGGVALGSWLGSLATRQPTSAVTPSFGPIAPTVPGYAPPTSSSPFAPLGKSVPGG